MTFVQPAWFWALLLVPAFGALYVFAEIRSKQMIARIVAPRLRNDLAAGVSYGKRRLRTVLMLLGLAALVTAMARPQWGYEWQEAKLKGRDVIVAVDVSKSMLANDLTPNRLTRARLATQDLLELLEGERLGLVAFAGSAFLQAPLTIDHGAVLSASQELDTELIPRGGTNLAAAIQTSLEAFGKGEGGDRALILFTDGEELDADGLKAAAKAKEAGVKIFTVGVGSPEGSVIPMERRDGGTDFVRDRSNEIVKSRLDEDRLKEIADITGGFYSRLEGPATIERIVNDGIKGLEETESDSKMSKKAIDRYQWPLGIGVGLLMIASMIGDRRRRAVPVGAAKGAAPKKMVAASLAIAVTLCLFDSSAKASETPESLYAAGKYKEALEAYEKIAPETDSGEDKAGRMARILRSLSNFESRPAELDFDIGAAAYKSKEYDKAMASFSQVLLSNDEKLREKAYYNLGNTLFQKGISKEKNEEKLPELESALQKYDDALRLNSENEDAKHNRDVVAKLIDDLKKEQEQKKQDQQKQDQKQDQQKQDQQKQDQQKQDQQKQDQQKQDQQKQDQQKQDQQKQDQQKQDQQKQDQQKQDQQKQDGQKKEDGQKEDQQPKDEPGETGESKKDQQNQDQPGGGQDKKQEGEGDPKEEQKEGGKGEQEKKQDQAGKEQEKEKSEGEKGEDEKENKDGSQSAKNEPKEEQGSKGEQNKEQEKGEGEQKDEQEPAEAPESADQPREGDLKAADAGEQKDGKDSGEMVQAAEDSEERKGEGYTKTEARRLLDSLKTEEDRIMLFDKKWREPVYKDW